MNIVISNGASQSLASKYRVLSLEEILWVSGGDDPGDSSSDGDSASVGSSSTPGTLGEVTISASAPEGEAGGGIGQAQALQLMQNIEIANTNPILAAMMFFALIAQAVSQHSSSPAAFGNPMGDPDPGYPSGP